jgi:predicted phosphodiesterase
VYGNVDGPRVRGTWPQWDRFDIGGLDVTVTHIGGRPGRWAPGVGAVLARERPGLFVCGHSHILQLERVTDPVPLLFVNPGAAGREGFHQVKTCMRLHIAAGRAERAEVVHLDEEADDGAAPAIDA